MVPSRNWVDSNISHIFTASFSKHLLNVHDVSDLYDMLAMLHYTKMAVLNLLELAV